MCMNHSIKKNSSHTEENSVTLGVNQFVAAWLAIIKFIYLTELTPTAKLNYNKTILRIQLKVKIFLYLFKKKVNCITMMIIEKYSNIQINWHYKLRKYRLAGTMN